MHRYAIGLGSNRPHGRHGGPRRVLLAALRALEARGVTSVAVSPTLSSRPVGPSLRQFANAAALVETAQEPAALLATLKQAERDFGRRRGRRWGPRVLDLDLLLWSGGAWRSRTLVVPHPRIAERGFVLRPLLRIAPGWRVVGGATVHHLAARLTRPRPVHRARSGSGP